MTHNHYAGYSGFGDWRPCQMSMAQRIVQGYPPAELSELLTILDKLEAISFSDFSDPLVEIKM